MAPVTPFDDGDAWTAVFPPTLTWLVTTPGTAHRVAQMLRALGIAWSSFSPKVAPVTVLRGSIAGAPGDRDRLGDGCELHRDPQLGAAVQRDDDSLVVHRGEAVEGQRHGIRPGRDVQEPELAPRVRLDRRPLARAEQLHRDARERGTLLVERRPVDASRRGQRLGADDKSACPDRSRERHPSEERGHRRVSCSVPAVGLDCMRTRDAP